MAPRTFADVRRDRKLYLRFVRKAQRAVDTQIERMERTIFRLLDRKTVLDVRDADRLAEHWRQVTAEQRKVEKSLADFYFILSRG